MEEHAAENIEDQKSLKGGDLLCPEDGNTVEEGPQIDEKHGNPHDKVEYVHAPSVDQRVCDSAMPLYMAGGEFQISHADKGWICPLRHALFEIKISGMGRTVQQRLKVGAKSFFCFAVRFFVIKLVVAISSRIITVIPAVLTGSVALLLNRHGEVGAGGYALRERGMCRNLRIGFSKNLRRGEAEEKKKEAEKKLFLPFLRT